MLSSTVERELHQHLEALTPSRQRQVLDFARALAATQPQGVAGRDLLPLAGTIDAADLAAISRAIADDCERVSPQDW